MTFEADDRHDSSWQWGHCLISVFLNPAKEREVSDTFTLKTHGGMGYPGGGVEFLSASLGGIYNRACFKRAFLPEYLLGPSFAVQVLLTYILTAHVQARIFRHGSFA